MAIETSPTTTEVGATKASGSMSGSLPPIPVTNACAAIVCSSGDWVASGPRCSAFGVRTNRNGRSRSAGQVG